MSEKKETFKQGEDVFFVILFAEKPWVLKFRIQKKAWSDLGEIYTLELKHPLLCEKCREEIATNDLRSMKLCDDCAMIEAEILERRNRNEGKKTKILSQTLPDQIGFGDYFALNNVLDGKIRVWKNTYNVRYDDLKRTKAEAISWALEFYKDIVKNLKEKPVGD
jgi:hypothetical protein